MKDTNTTMRASMTGMREAAEAISIMLKTVSDDIEEDVTLGQETVFQADPGPSEVTSCYGWQTSLGMIIWRDPRRDDGVLPDADRFATIRIMRDNSLTLTVRLPHRIPRSALKADDAASLALLTRDLAHLIDDGDWSRRTTDLHAANALHAVSGGREGILRWPNPWTGASFTTLEAMATESMRDRPPVEADFIEWRDFAESLTPCLDMTASYDKDTGIHALNVSLRTEKVVQPGNAVESLRSLAIHRQERRP